MNWRCFMSLLRDKITRAIESLSNDDKDWRGFNVTDVAQKVHDLLEPEIKALADKNAELEAALGTNNMSDSEVAAKVAELTTTVQESVNSIAKLNEDLTAANAANDAAVARIKDLEDGIIEFMDKVADADGDAVAEATEKLATLLPAAYEGSGTPEGPVTTGDGQPD